MRSRRIVERPWPLVWLSATPASRSRAAFRRGDQATHEIGGLRVSESLVASDNDGKKNTTLKGPRGRTGAAGEAGPQGQQGLQGPPGPPVRRADVLAVVEDKFSEIQSTIRPKSIE